MLVRCDRLDAGMILSVDDDRPAAEPGELAITPGMLKSAAGRLENRARIIHLLRRETGHPGHRNDGSGPAARARRACDLRTRARI
jgi:hypothetical protein